MVMVSFIWIFLIYMLQSNKEIRSTVTYYYIVSYLFSNLSAVNVHMLFTQKQFHSLGKKIQIY